MDSNNTLNNMNDSDTIKAKVTEEDKTELGKQCNHNFNDKGNTLVEMKVRHMVAPNTIMCHCKKCKKAFKFQKDEKGNWKALD